MRSPRQIAFRLGQEFANLRHFLSPPAARKAGALPLPDPAAVIERLRGSEFERELLALADQILEHRFPVFGGTIETGPEIPWRRDSVHGIETPPEYFRRIPYLDFARAGDHKFIWELNRHQHLVALAQAYRFSAREQYLREIRAEIESWNAQNPFARGINWTSALEVAFRALSWIWVRHLVGDQGFDEALYRHGSHLEANLSVYFSPNTHLLGEAVALHALGLLFNVDGWRTTGARIVREELDRQVFADGAYFEQSTYYHVYALDLFLFHYLLAGHPRDFEPALGRMADYLDAILGPDRKNPLFGDDDGGRLFHPYGDRLAFGRATLAAARAALGRGEWYWESEDLKPIAAWWLGAAALDTPAPARRSVESRVFADCGTVVLSDGDLHVVMDAGPFGRGSAGHSHSDTLSLVVRDGAREILVDSGTFTYVSDPKLRDAFRGSAAHNTVRFDGLSQATPAGPFRWSATPAVRLLKFEPGLAEAECEYAGFRHRRRVELSAGTLTVTDEITGPAGEHLVEQFWHLGDGAEIECPGEMTAGERSRVFGSKEPCRVLVATYRGALPAKLVARYHA